MCIVRTFVYFESQQGKSQNKMHEVVLLFLNLGQWQEGRTEHAYAELAVNDLQNRRLQLMIFSCLGVAWQRRIKWASWASRSKGK